MSTSNTAGDGGSLEKRHTCSHSCAGRRACLLACACASVAMLAQACAAARVWLKATPRRPRHVDRAPAAPSHDGAPPHEGAPRRGRLRLSRAPPRHVVAPPLRAGTPVKQGHGCGGGGRTGRRRARVPDRDRIEFVYIAAKAHGCLAGAAAEGRSPLRLGFSFFASPLRFSLPLSAWVGQIPWGGEDLRPNLSILLASPCPLLSRSLSHSPLSTATVVAREHPPVEEPDRLFHGSTPRTSIVGNRWGGGPSGAMGGGLGWGRSVGDGRRAGPGSGGLADAGVRIWGRRWVWLLGGDGGFGGPGWGSRPPANRPLVLLVPPVG